MKKILTLLFLFLAMSCTTDERLDEIEELQSQIEQLLASLENSDIDSASAEAALEALQAQLSELQTEIESEDADEGEYGLTIGDDFYPMTEGYFDYDSWPDFKYGYGEDCDNLSELENDHLIYLEFYETSLRPLESFDEYIGSGKTIEIYLYSDASNIEEGEYEDIKNLLNDVYGAEFVLNTDAARAIFDESSEYDELMDYCYSWSGYIESILYDTVENGEYSDEVGPGIYEEVTLNDRGEFTLKRKKNTVSITFEGFAEESNLPVSLNFEGTLSDYNNSSKSMKRKRRN
jgi:hypothetical protein